MWGKQIVILGSILLTCCEVESSENATEDCHEFAKSEDENSMKDYSGYQVLKIPHGLDRISIAFLSKRELPKTNRFLPRKNELVFFLVFFF